MDGDSRRGSGSGGCSGSLTVVLISIVIVGGVGVGEVEVVVGGIVVVMLTLAVDREPPHNYTGDGVYLTFLWGKLAQLEAQNCSKHNHGPTRPPSSRNNLNTPSFRARRLCGWLRLAVAPTVSSFRRKRDPESSFSEEPFKEAYATLYPTRHPVFGFRNGLCWGVWVFMCPPSVRFWQF